MSINQSDSLFPSAPQEIVTMDDVAALLRGYRFKFVSERELQDGIEQVLLQHGIPHVKELTMSEHDRPDFMVGNGIALEVKIKGTLSQLIRQVHRYALLPEVTGVLVVGTPRWFNQIVPVLNGKPVYAVRLVGGML